MHTAVSTYSLVYVVGKRCVFRRGVIFDSEEFLGSCRTGRSENCVVGLFVNNVICINVVVIFLGVKLLDNVLFESAYKSIRTVVHIGGFFTHSRNDKGSSRFVNKNRVNLVYDCKYVSALNHALLVDGHIVTKIVEAVFVVCSVGYVSVVSRFLFSV